MFIHYLKIAFRNIWKYKTQSLTGIFGLAFGLACFVPALYWMRYETSYDSFYPDAENIYRIYAVEKQSGKVNELVPAIVEKKLQEQFPGMENSTVFFSEINACKTENVPHIRLRTIDTDSSTFLRVFKQEFISGDAMNPLQAKFNLVITESMAKGLFGDVETAIGKQLQSTTYFFNPPYTVTAVVKDPPPNTNLPFDALLFHDMIPIFREGAEEHQWMNFFTQLYVRLHPGTDIAHLAEQLRDMPSRLKGNENIELRIVPLNDVRHRLSSDIPFTMNFIQLFVAAGILLMFSAVFNFLNLHLDLFRQRRRELRQRTVHGAKNRQLIRQMLTELACSILLALLFGGSFVVFARHAFSGLLGLPMEMQELVRLFTVCGAGVMALMLLIGFISFWRLSHQALQPLSKRRTAGQSLLRRVAVSLQLAVSIVFIVAAWVVLMQIRFVNHQDLGFDRRGIIQIHGLPPFTQMSIRTALIDKLRTFPQIKAITTGNFEPQHNAKADEMITKVEIPGKEPSEEIAFNLITTDNRFADVFGLKILQGEWQKEGGEQDIVLNEEAVRAMGLTDPVGTILRISIFNIDMKVAEEEMDVKYKVVGVVKDFHTLSFRSRIHPTIFRYYYSRPESKMAQGNILYISVTPGTEQETIRQIKAILPDVDPTVSDLRLTTLEDLYNSFNRSEQAGFKLFSILAAVCLLISLFGIYAVAAASTQRRRKEIAIRKVSGANGSDIIRIFFREYTAQVIIAAAFALPIAYIAMAQWLQSYAYRTDIPWWLLAGVLAGVTAIVLLTVSGQVLKAARSNPADVVKSE